jgi:hypothetical protein
MSAWRAGRYTRSMQWEVGRYTHDPEYFSAEAVNDEPGSEGEMYATVFYGLRSEQRAKQFADWQNALIEWERPK